MKMNRKMDEIKEKKDNKKKPLQGAESTFHIEIRGKVQRKSKL